MRRSELPDDIVQLRELAGETTDPEAAIVINGAILGLAPRDIVAMNRLGRAYEALGSIVEAQSRHSARPSLLI